LRSGSGERGDDFANPDILTAYYIGTDRIDANRARMEQVSQAIIDKIATDTLTVVTPARRDVHRMI